MYNIVFFHPWYKYHERWESTFDSINTLNSLGHYLIARAVNWQSSQNIKWSNKTHGRAYARSHRRFAEIEPRHRAGIHIPIYIRERSASATKLYCRSCTSPPISLPPLSSVSSVLSLSSYPAAPLAATEFIKDRTHGRTGNATTCESGNTISS